MNIMADPFSLQILMSGFDNLNVKTDPNIWIPQPGDRVVLTDEFFETMGDGKECARLGRLPWCTVDEVYPVPIGQDGDYSYHYSITVKETNYNVDIFYEKYTGA